MSVSLRLCAVLAALVTVLMVFSATASATHNRATQLSWTAGAAPGEVHFSIDFVARRGYYGTPGPVVGETIADPTLEFGDGESVTPSLLVTEVDGDVIYTHGTVDYTYSGTGPYTAAMGSCCRLSASSGHVNNGDLNYRVHTLVDLAKASSSPSIAVAPVVYCPTSGTCSFAFAGSGANAGNHLRWRFATPEETGDTFFIQPGPPFAPSTATIDAGQGRITWDTTGAAVNTGGLPTYYSTQVVAEEVNPAGETVADTVADFFIALDDSQTEQPHCHDTDGNGLVDNDSDGLCDNWETEGIDVNDDHNADISLPEADPNRQDIYLEIDYMEGRKPRSDALQDVQQAFAAHGISLHFFVDEQVPFTENLLFGEDCSGACPANTVEFDELKENYFGASGDRASVNHKERLEALRFAYHYVLYANELSGSRGVSGYAELPGNDLTVTLGSWRTAGGSGPPIRRNEAGTLMHELGHNLALWHGGGDTVNCKPNYLSVMNYTRQTTGFIAAQLDYSDAVLPTLSENNLNEAVGIQGPSGAQVVHGPGSHRIGTSLGAIDWDGVGGVQSNVAADVNSISDVGGCNFPSPGQNLVGWDDWANLALAFQATADFADGVHSSLLAQEPEISATDFAGDDSDVDGVTNIQDECPTEPGPAANAGCPVPPASKPGSQSPPPGPSRTTPPVVRLAPNTKLSGARFGKGKRTAKFLFAGSGEPGLRFQCRFDRGRFKLCRSPQVYRNLGAGRHVFRVRAVDPAGQVDQTPSVRSFRTRAEG